MFTASEILKFDFCVFNRNPGLLASKFTGSGTVLKVIDGDTFTCQSRNGFIRVRLLGVDAPEKKQDFGLGSRDVLINLVQGKIVYLKHPTIGKYKRLVAMPYVDDINICLYMIQVGAAWVYPKYCPSDYFVQFYNAMLTAKAAKVGLWAFKDPLAPYIYRHL